MRANGKLTVNAAVLPYKELGGITGVDLDLGEGDRSLEKGT